jgi:hypothetical protein
VLINENLVQYPLKECTISLYGAGGNMLEIKGTTLVKVEVLKGFLSYKKKTKEIFCTGTHSSEGNPTLAHYRQGSDLFLTAIVVKGLKTDFILGTSAWKIMGVVINANTDTITIDKQEIRIWDGKITKSNSEIKPGQMKWVSFPLKKQGTFFIEGESPDPRLIIFSGVVTTKEDNVKLLAWNVSNEPIQNIETIFHIEEEFETFADTEHFCRKDINIGPISNSKRRKILNLLLKYKDRFREYTGPGETANLPPVKLPLKRDYHPIQDKLFARRPEDHQFVKEQNDKLLERGLIEPDDGAWRANALILKKKDGKPRYTVDYRSLNSQSEFIAFPMPLITEIMGSLHGVKYLSKVDFCDGFWAIRIQKIVTPHWICH